MVLWIGTYNVILQYGTFNAQIAAAWIGFPFAYVFAMLCDLFVVSKLAKGVAFRWFVKHDDSALKKIIWISICMAVPLQLLIAGPLIRLLFRALFPVGSVLE